MKGEPFEDLKRTLRVIMDRLQGFDNAKFNVITFGSNWHKLFGENLPTNDPKAIGVAKEFTESLSPNGGGTELWEPLKSALLLSGGGSEDILLPRNLFVLTDGHPTNTELVSPPFRTFGHSLTFLRADIGACKEECSIREVLYVWIWIEL